MGLFTPKYPKSDTAGATGARESRSTRRDRQVDAARQNLADDFKAAERDSKARSARFWDDYERRNGTGSVDYS